MKNLRDQLKHLISENEIEKAIQLMKEKTAGMDNSIHAIAIGLANRYKRFKEKSLFGLEQQEQELSQIIYDALQAINQMEEAEEGRPVESVKKASISIQEKPATPRKEVTPSPNPTEPDSRRKRLMMFAGLGLLVLAIIIAIAMGGGDDEGYEADDEFTAQSDINAGSEDVTYEAPSIAGTWLQRRQSWGPQNDCDDCTISIQEGTDGIYQLSSTTWNGNFTWDDEETEFIGELEYSGTVEDASMYWDGDSLHVLTTLQGTDFEVVYVRP